MAPYIHGFTALLASNSYGMARASWRGRVFPSTTRNRKITTNVGSQRTIKETTRTKNVFVRLISCTLKPRTADR